MILKQDILKRSRILVTACVFCLLYSLIACLPATAFDLLFCRGAAWLASLYLGATCDGATLSLRSGHVLVVTHACGGSDFFILVCSMIAWYVMAPGGSRINGRATLLHRMTRTTHLREYAYGGQARISGSPRRFALPPSDQTMAPCEAGRVRRLPDLGEPQSPNNKAIRQSRNKAIFEAIGKVLILLFMAWAFVNGVNGLRVVLSYWTRLASEALLPERFDAAVHMVSGVMIFFPALLAVWWFCKTRTKEVLHERES